MECLNWPHISPTCQIWFVVMLVCSSSFTANGFTTPIAMSGESTTELVSDLLDGTTSDEMTTFTTMEGTVAMTTTGADTSRDDDARSVMLARFIIRNKSAADVGDQLRDHVENSINALLKQGHDYYNTSKVKNISPGSRITIVELYFTRDITVYERRDVTKVLYEVVMRNNTLADLEVYGLSVQVETTGSLVKIEDACSITPCPAGMKCTSEGNECVSMCATNLLFCLNGGTCKGSSGFISCICDEKYSYSGPRCQTKEEAGESEGKPDLYIGIIAASAIAVIIVLAILLATCINIVNKKRIRTGRPDELFGIENVVALELTDEQSHVPGMATQTDDSFLLARSHKDGVPPKPGHDHKIMQTNDSFLLAKAQLLKAHGGAASRHTGAGSSPVGVVSGNTRRLSGPSRSGATPIASTSGANGVTRKVSTKKDRAPEPPQNGQPGPVPSAEQATPFNSKTYPTSTTGGALDDSAKKSTPQENGAKNTTVAEVRAGGDVPKSGEPERKKAELEISPGRKILKV